MSPTKITNFRDPQTAIIEQREHGMVARTRLQAEQILSTLLAHDALGQLILDFWDLENRAHIRRQQINLHAERQHRFDGKECSSTAGWLQPSLCEMCAECLEIGKSHVTERFADDRIV